MKDEVAEKYVEKKTTPNLNIILSGDPFLNMFYLSAAFMP